MNGTNILSARNDVSLAQNDVSITTRELAEQLGTRPNVITENAKKCLPNKRIENGKPTYWSKAEVTVLLEFMKSNKIGAGVNLSNHLIGTSTDLTPALRIRNAMLEMQAAYEDELAILRAKNEEMQPKAVVYDEFVEREKFCNFRDGANYLRVSQSDFMKLLKSRYIYKNSSGEYRCYGEFSDYFALRPFSLGEKTRQQLMLTIKGLEFFRKKMNSAKAENA